MKAAAAAAAALAWLLLLQQPGAAPGGLCGATLVRAAAAGAGGPRLREPHRAAGAAAKLSAGTEEECFAVPQGLCLQDGVGRSFVVGRSHFPPDLQIWYQFDKSLPVDESGHMHHLTDSNQVLSPLTVGPGVMGRGGSAYFDGRGFRFVQAAKALDSPVFSITLWIYLLEDSIGSWRTIFSRGSRPEELMPALLLRPEERRLHVRASPRADAGGASLDASGVLPLRRWTHVAVVSTGSVLRLLINGVKDSEVILEESPGSCEAGLHIGRDPWRAGTKAFVDDFRWYTRDLPSDELRAMVFPGLTGAAGADAVSLGCRACRFPEAARSCGGRSHLCSLQELFSGGFHTARAMGWLAASSEVWFHDEQGDDLFNGRTKLGLCCLD